MSAPRPVILVTNPVHEEVRARLERIGCVEMNRDTEPWNASQLAARLRNADAMMGFMTDCVDASVLAASPRLRVIACALKGFDSYDAHACSSAGVWLTVVPDLLTAPTAELAIGLAISLARNVKTGDTLVQQGRFKGWRAHLYGSGLARSTVAVVGLGRVGQAIVSRLQGFDCARVLGVDLQKKPQGIEVVTLSAALAQSDFVFVAVPLTAASRHLLGSSAIRRCKAGQFIINVGRGSVIDENAVADALDAGLLGGYAADVFAFEDWALPNRPREVPTRLLGRDNTLLTPHLGSAVRQVRLAIEHRAVDNILAALAGQRPADAINTPDITPPVSHSFVATD